MVTLGKAKAKAPDRIKKATNILPGLLLQLP